MKSSLFFELDEQSDMSKGMVFFHYTRVYCTGYYPISVHLGPEAISFYWSGQDGEIGFRENTRLFRLFYSDFENPKGKLASQLNQLLRFVKESSTGRYISYQPSGTKSYLHELPEGVSYYSNQEVLAPALLGKSIPAHGYEKIEGRQLELTSVSFAVLLLDFLFDLQHGEIFIHSPHYQHLLKVIRENFLFGSILDKMEFYFQVVQRKNHQSAQGKSKVVKQELESFARNASNAWLNRLTDEQGPSVLAPSSWFHNQLEKEMKHALARSAGLRKNDKQQQIVTWYLGRFNYLAAIKNSFPKQDWLKVVAGLVWGISVLVIFLIGKPSWGILILAVCGFFVG